MDAKFSEDQDITSLDIFDTFVAALHKDTNVLESEALKALVFNQFKSYGDFDKTMNEVAQQLSGIHVSTGDAIKAIDDKDTGSLKEAYSKLKAYQKRIHELEEDIYIDEMTGVYNRKYLLNQELDEDARFKTDGHLMHITVNNFLDINKEHGHEAGDAVLKLISKTLQNRLRPMGIHLIRYLGVQFIALAKLPVAGKVEKVFEESVTDLLEKRFKTHSGDILSIEIQFEHTPYKKGESFQETCEGLY